MADSNTVYNNWVLPEVGASKSTWGTKLNNNFVAIDAMLRVATPANQGSFVPKAIAAIKTGTMTFEDTVTINDSLIVVGAAEATSLEVDDFIRVPNGTSVAPAVQFGSAADGIYNGTSGIVAVIDGAVAARLEPNVLATTDGATLMTRAKADNRYPLMSEIVPPGRTLIGGDGINAIGDLSANRTISVDASVVRTSRSLIAGNGLTGLGDLSANRTVALGTPSSVTNTSGNTVTATSHTHALAAGTVRAQYAEEASAGTIGYPCLMRLSPGGVANTNQNIPASAFDGFCNASSNNAVGTPAGTWKCLGYAGGGGNNDRTTTFIRLDL